MPNTRVMGKVTDEYGAGLGSLSIEAYDMDRLGIEQHLGSTETLATGEFSIGYDPSAYGVAETRPDIVVRIYDPVGRELFASHVVRNVTRATLDIGQIIIEADVLRGWRVTLGIGLFAASPPPVRPEA